MKTTKTARKMKTPKGNEYPEWVHRPLRLTNDELKHPLPVIEQFFKQYPLVAFRALLSDWLYLLFSNEVHTGATFFTLSEELERFVEAVFQWAIVNGGQ
jgi:hypothetical protein